MKNIIKFPSNKKVYIIGEQGIQDEFIHLGLNYSGGTTPQDNVFIDLMDFSSITSDPDVGAVVCGLDMHINYKKIARAFTYLRENEGCLFIATNLDSTFPTHGSVYPGKIIPSLHTCHMPYDIRYATYPIPTADKNLSWATPTGAGAVIASLMYCTERQPLVIGKPEKAMLDCILETYVASFSSSSSESKSKIKIIN